MEGYHGSLRSNEILLLEGLGGLHLEVSLSGRQVGTIIDAFANVLQQRHNHKLNRLLLFQNTLKSNQEQIF